MPIKAIQRIIGDNSENILHLAGLRRRMKTKRGLFDFEGEISKTLFGILADTDASYYNNELDKLYANHTKKYCSVCKESN